MLGNVNIYFGKVVSIEDSEKILRVKVRINGLTHELSDNDLPYYFPWYGVNYLPVEGDIVPVIIFDHIITSGFYGRSIDKNKSNISDDDYNNYLEIYRRDGVELTYKKSEGICFMNDDTLVQIETQKLSLFVSYNSITITPDMIKIGDKAEQYALQGDKVVKLFEDVVDQMIEITKNFLPTSEIMIAATAACGTPFTAGFLAPITTLGIKMQLLFTSLSTLSVGINPTMLQSQKTMIE